MSQVLAARPVTRLRDLVELGKPRLSLLVLFTAATGVWFAPSALSLPRTVFFLVATAALVSAANTLNCWIETELDGRMHRTRNRPLPAGRMEPRVAFVSGLTVATLSLSALLVATNGLTAVLGVVALLSYVLVYTPLKRVTPWAVLVGGIPGALPPLMGWTASTDMFAARGWLLFGILFLWQLPHFLAISLYLKDDFRRGGIRVMPLVFGDRITRAWLFTFTVALVGVSLLPEPLGMSSRGYTVTAAVIGLAFLGMAGLGLRSGADRAWATRTFGFTLIYLPVLITALVLGSL